MIVYRYCSDEELDRLNRKNKIKGFHVIDEKDLDKFKYKLNSSYIVRKDGMNDFDKYDIKEKYLHFYLDEDNVYKFDPVEPENFVEFMLPNEYWELYNCIGNYYGPNADGNMVVRKANQLAIPSRLITREMVKNIKPKTSEEYKEDIKKLTKNALY